MFYPASATIAANHPALREDLQQIDHYLADLYGAPFLVDIAADLLGMAPDYLERLLGLYLAAGAIERRPMFICPHSGDYLKQDRQGRLWCDICERSFAAEECDEVEVYFAQAEVAPRPPAPLVRAEQPPPVSDRTASPQATQGASVWEEAPSSPTAPDPATDSTLQLKSLHHRLRDARRYLDLLEQQAIVVAPGPALASLQLAIEKQRERIIALEQHIDDLMAAR